ncbi:MAG: DUF6311 domain-containing protein [Oscillospiraceae bacterium]|nr:DUF6311 domain-containing protein [Oscillospiraceae bacterium]
MELKNAKKNRLFLFLCGAFIGAVAFFVIFSPSALDPTNLEYVRGGYVERDIIQHYAGWRFYRSSPVTFPLGIAEGMNAPEGASVVYSDSIPIFALIFKALDPLLPADFQYFGIFVLISYILQGGSAAILLALFIKNSFAVLAGTLPFIFSPILMERAFRHTSLTAHYLILLALYCYFSHYMKKGKHYDLWIVLSVLTPLIHTYFLPMIYAIFLAEVIDCGNIKEKVSSLLHLIGCLFLSVLSLYLVGAFKSGSSGTSYGYGYFSMNINSIFNPSSISGIHWSLILPMLPQGYGTYEGFNYWGLGMLIAFFLISIHLLISFKKSKPLHYAKEHPALLAVCIILTLFAVSTTVIANNTAFIQFSLPQKIYELCSIFRSSGRMFWLVTYLVYLFCIVYLAHHFSEKHIGTLLILLLVMIQLADMSSVITFKHKSMTEYTAQFDILTDSPFFEQNKNTYSFVNCPGNSAFRGLYAALWCSENNMSTNFPFLARYDAAQHAAEAEKTRSDLLNGIYDENTLYLFSSEDESLFHDVAYYVNGDDLVCGKIGREFYFIAPANDKFSLPAQNEGLILYDDFPLIVADYSDDIWDHGVLLSKPNTITFLNNAFSKSFLDGASVIYCDGVRYYIERIYDDPGYIMVEVDVEDGHSLLGKALSTDIRK